MVKELSPVFLLSFYFFKKWIQHVTSFVAVCWSELYFDSFAILQSDQVGLHKLETKNHDFAIEKINGTPRDSMSEGRMLRNFRSLVKFSQRDATGFYMTTKYHEKYCRKNDS